MSSDPKPLTEGDKRLLFMFAGFVAGVLVMGLLWGLLPDSNVDKAYKDGHNDGITYELKYLEDHHIIETVPLICTQYINNKCITLKSVK